MEARAEARVKVAIILAPQASLQERVVETNLGNSWILFYFQATARSRGGGICLVPAGTRSADTVGRARGLMARAHGVGGIHYYRNTNRILVWNTCVQ